MPQQPPRKPPRPSSSRLPAVEDRVEPGAVHSFRPPSFGERPTIPPIPPDHVPRVTARERVQTQLGMPAPPSEPPRPPMPQRKPIEVQQATADDEGNRPSRLEQQAFSEAVHIQHRGLRATIPAVVVTAIITAVSAYLLKPKDAPPPVVQCLTKSEFDESMRERDERLARRLDTIETNVSYLTVAVRLVQDRLPPQK